jgi:hypothetical protein
MARLAAVHRGVRRSYQVGVFPSGGESTADADSYRQVRSIDDHGLACDAFSDMRSDATRIRLTRAKTYDNPAGALAASLP